jgi:hypothetical protein
MSEMKPYSPSKVNHYESDAEYPDRMRKLVQSLYRESKTSAAGRDHA